MIVKSFIHWFKYVKGRILDNNLDGFIWLLNLGPKSAGFSILDEKRHWKFWVLHFTLIFYGYFLGSIHFQVMHGKGMEEFFKFIINMSIVILAVTNSFWYLAKRSLIKKALIEMSESDELAKSPETFNDYQKFMKKIKVTVVLFYFVQIFTGFLFYFPSRLSFENNLGATHCIGMALDTLLEQLICRSILITQEYTLSTTMLNYQALLIFVFAHTFIMFSCLSKDMTSIVKDNCELNIVTQKLSLLIERHVLLLKVVGKLRCLYSMPIGVNFGANVLCVCFIFYLPIKESLIYLPVLTYCFIIFYMYCFLCQKLIDASEEFERAIYDCGWESLGVKKRKTVYIMLLQAQKPVTVLAADIIPLNIYTFARIVQGIYKFVTVVKM